MVKQNKASSFNLTLCYTINPHVRYSEEFNQVLGHITSKIRIF